MPPRVVVINHRRNLGRFRATATTRDHANGEPCGCGGTCCEDKKKLGLRDRYQRSKDSKDTRCDMAIDAKYAQGDKSETRHFVIPDNLVDPRGSPPQGAYVMAKLRENADHRAMIRNGWRLEDVEGYYKPV